MSKERSIIKFIFEQTTRLSCITRYNNTPKLAPESVAEHSYYVTLMAAMIGDYLNDIGDCEIDVESLMKMALFHDVEEIISGDIIKVLKSGGFKKELDLLNEKSMHFLVDGLEKQGAYYYEFWKEAKTRQSLESRVIELIDLFSVIVYCIKEIHLGNQYFKEILEFAVKGILQFAVSIPVLKKFIRDYADYALGYLLDDKKISEDINKAVRIWLDDEEYGT